MAGYWPSSFFLRVYGPRHGVEVHKHAKKERGQYQAILTEQAWSIFDCFHDPIMQYVLGGSLHKNNAIYLLLGLYHASVN